jgi:MarR family transcriptional regulator, 2-MHQ and catechol-resistance regulon repressor
MTTRPSKKTAVNDARDDHYMNRIKHHGSKYDEFHKPSVEVALNLAYTYDVIYSHMSRKIEAHGLSLGAFNVLMVLSRCDEAGCQMSELGKLLLVSRANVTGLVDCLVNRGLVDRTEHDTDRRVRMVKITTKGSRLLEAILPAHYARMREMLKGLSDKDKTLLSNLLTRLRHGTQKWLDEQ